MTRKVKIGLVFAGAQERASVTEILKTRSGTVTELWGFPIGSIGSHKLGQVRPARNGDGFEAIRGMKSGAAIQSFSTRKAAEQWIVQCDVWGPLR
jgi:hypothetical protein